MGNNPENPCFGNWDAATLLRILCQDCPEAVCILDADLRFSYVNEHLAHLFGYRFSELCGHPLTLLLPDEPDETRQNILSRFQALLRGEHVSFPRVAYLPKKDGENVAIQIIARIFQNNENERHVIATLVDMSAALRLEKLRNEAERVVRHDMKSPLVALLGFVNSLLKDESLGEAHRTKVHYLQEIGQKLFYLVNHTMDLFRMEEGSYRLQPEDYDFFQALGTVLAESSHLAQRKGCRTRIFRNGELLDSVQQSTLPCSGKISLVQSMLANLVNNALEASPEGEDVVLRLDEHPKEGRIVLDIHNKGSVPIEIRDRFFEKYATHGKDYGTGLGTYSARLIARAHGGDITMRTHDAEGTHVTVTLPTHPEKQD